jgi:hypothetical protein
MRECWFHVYESPYDGTVFLGPRHDSLDDLMRIDASLKRLGGVMPVYRIRVVPHADD